MITNHLYEIAPLFIRVMDFGDAGDSESRDGHAHLYGHAHFLAVGEVDLEMNGKVTHYVAPAMIWIEALQPHKITATVPGTRGCCINAVRSADMSGEPLDPALIPEGSTMWGVGAQMYGKTGL